MKKLNMLYIGHLNEQVRAFQRYRVFCDLGHDVKALSSVPTSNSYYHKSKLIERIMWKISLPLDSTNVNKELLRLGSSSSFSMVWIDKGNTIRPSTLKKIKKNNPNVKIVSYAEDDMFAKHNHSYYYKKSLQYYNVVFTTKSYNADKKELPSFGAKKVVFIGNSFDKKFHRPIKLTESEITKYSTDVGFIGSFEEERANSILYLASKGIDITVWGDGWDKYRNTYKNLTINNSGLFGEEYVKCIQATKINLGFLRKKNRDNQTARSVEIPACRSFMLAERTNEHLDLFEEGIEAAFFETNEELYEKVEYYLKNNELRKQISEYGYKKSVELYSHHSRLEKMLEIVLGECT